MLWPYIDFLPIIATVGLLPRFSYDLLPAYGHLYSCKKELVYSTWNEGVLRLSKALPWLPRLQQCTYTRCRSNSEAESRRILEEYSSVLLQRDQSYSECRDIQHLLNVAFLQVYLRPKFIQAYLHTLWNSDTAQLRRLLVLHKSKFYQGKCAQQLRHVQ